MNEIFLLLKTLDVGRWAWYYDYDLDEEIVIQLMLAFDQVKV
jgi:hypothetical protein